MLAATYSGGDIIELHHADEPSATVAIGASAHGWEHTLHGRTALIAQRGLIAVATDATLYHRSDLVRALALPAASLPSDAELILAAYEAWGVDGFARLEGDFAFVLWDGASARLVAARDFSGHRSLFCARVGTSVLVASTVGALLADAAVPRHLDLAAVATVAAGLWGHSSRTAYRDVEELPAGHALVWTRGAEPRVTPFWHAPETILHRRQPLEDAAAELRALLVDAVRERLAPEGSTGLSLSGGWDSTAVGGAAMLALAGDPTRRLQPVSISYPEGDPGREDELIRDVVAQWGIGTTWLPVDTIPMFGDASREAAARDLPFAHAFEHWNRALSRGARSSGARVMLDGVGGDQLFQVSDIFLSDLFGQGRWIELGRQWRGRGGRGLDNFWRWVVHPALPVPIRRLIARVRGMEPPRHHFHRLPPEWIVARFLTEHNVLDREAAAAPVLPRSSRVLGETHAYLRFPFFARIVSTLRTFALEEGVELRSPLLDDRVVGFAARRPWNERAEGRETKIVLRRAMRGLVPDHVLAPRPHRTGITSAYFLRQMRGPGRALVEATLQDPLLASLGVIHLPRLRAAWAHVLEHDDDELGARVYFTLQAELWLRARASLLPTST
jgi:asparagine synthase (glutamine-hydrolysing)